MEKKAGEKISEKQEQALLTRLKEAQEEIGRLRDFEKRSRSVLGGLPNPIVIYDIEGKVKYLNPAFTKTFGWTLEELKGKKIDFVPENSMPETLSAIQQVFLMGQTEFETRRYTKKKKLLDVDISCGSFKNDRGDFIGTFVILRDITGKKKNEKKINTLNKKLLTRAKELESLNGNLQEAVDYAMEMGRKAEEASKAKSSFLANMSHEIRTPMNGVIGMTNILLDEQNSPETRDGLETIKRSAETLLTILNDILDFSKIEAGRLDIEAIDFNLRNMVEETLVFLSMRSHEKGIELTYMFDDEVPSLLVGDPTRVRQIMMNLVGNAVKFTDKGGDISIRIGLVEETEKQAKISFMIKDTGIGMSKESTEKLFQSFHQVDASTTRKYGGTGLGLAISKQLCELMGGDIQVESQVGKGSVFSFTILFDKQKDALEKLKFPPEDLKGKRVLIVDDNKLNLETLEGFLVKWGFFVEATTDGSHAVQMCKLMAKTNLPFDMVITDYQMPSMDGATLGRIIRTNPDTAHIKLIMLTSRGLRGEAKKMKEIGFDGYLSKPIRRSQLFDVIILVFSGEKNEKNLSEDIITKHKAKDIRMSRIKILVAEDHPVNQKVIQRILERLGFQYHIAGDGLKALEELEKNHYDIVLMDVQMPVMDGYECAACIRSEKSKVLNRDIPIIALTAHAMKGDMEKCLSAGMNDYTTKPVNSNALVQKITRLLIKKSSIKISIDKDDLKAY
ncbi:MAG: response regulator [Desulfobacula sp.]|jgi:PAS domain S-box-containing protein